MPLECQSPIKPVINRRRLPDGRVVKERANPITPIVDMHTGHVHFVRLGPVARHIAGRTLAYCHEGVVHINRAYLESHCFYEELCKRGDPERGIDPSPKHWERFCVLREVIYRGERAKNLPPNFWHPHVAELRADKRGTPSADISALLAQADAELAEASERAREEG